MYISVRNSKEIQKNFQKMEKDIPVIPLASNTPLPQFKQKFQHYACKSKYMPSFGTYYALVWQCNL